MCRPHGVIAHPARYVVVQIDEILIVGSIVLLWLSQYEKPIVKLYSPQEVILQIYPTVRLEVFLINQRIRYNALISSVVVDVADLKRHLMQEHEQFVVEVSPRLYHR